MTTRDYYQVLGVGRSATPDEIKKAYRRLAVKYHPDHNQGQKDAEDKFKELSEAYAVLSDKNNRRKYDTFGHAGFKEQHSNEDIFRNFDMGNMFRDFGFRDDDLFSNLFGGQSRTRYGGPYGRRAKRRDNYSDFFGDFGQDRPAPRMKGGDITYDLRISLYDAVFGAEKLIAFNTDDGVVKLTAKVPQGIQTGKKLRLAGKGQPSPDAGGSPGDLLVTILVEPHPVFKREGENLVRDLEIKLSEAVLGTDAQVETLDGKTLNLKVPPGTLSNTRLRIKGHGALDSKGKGRGDMYVRLMVQTPKELTERQKELFKALADEGL